MSVILLLATVNQLSLFNTVVLKPREVIVFSLIKKEKRHHHRMPLLSYYNNESIFIIIVFIFVLIFVSKDIRIIKQSNLCYLILHNVRSISFFLCFRSKLRRWISWDCQFLDLNWFILFFLMNLRSCFLLQCCLLSLCCRLSRLPDWFGVFCSSCCYFFLQKFMCCLLYTSTLRPCGLTFCPMFILLISHPARW